MAMNTAMLVSIVAWSVLYVQETPEERREDLKLYLIGLHIVNTLIALLEVLSLHHHSFSSCQLVMLSVLVRFTRLQGFVCGTVWRLRWYEGTYPLIVGTTYALFAWVTHEFHVAWAYAFLDMSTYISLDYFDFLHKKVQGSRHPMPGELGWTYL